MKLLKIIITILVTLSPNVKLNCMAAGTTAYVANKLLEEKFENKAEQKDRNLETGLNTIVISTQPPAVVQKDDKVSYYTRIILAALTVTAASSIAWSDKFKYHVKEFKDNNETYKSATNKLSKMFNFIGRKTVESTPLNRYVRIDYLKDHEYIDKLKKGLDDFMGWVADDITQTRYQELLKAKNIIIADENRVPLEWYVDGKRENTYVWPINLEPKKETGCELF